MLETVHVVIEWIALGIELLAVAVIVAAVLMLSIRRGTVRYLFHLEESGAYQSYIHQLGRPFMLALDLLVAADRDSRGHHEQCRGSRTVCARAHLPELGLEGGN